MSQLVRILVIVFLAAFAAGTTAHAAATTDMSLKMSMSGMGDGGMADCQDCPGEDIQASACDQFCLTVLAAIFKPASAALPDGKGVVDALIDGPPGSWDGPPDPYPPRSIL